MKKSFKKAGAAVLSMSMLLAMGAVSMPTYAAPTTTPPGDSGVATNTSVNTTGTMKLPGAVYISMPGMYKQGQGNGVADDQATSDALKYDYLDKGITDATVKIFKVAELSGSGWSWVGLNDTEIGELTALLHTSVSDGNGGTVSAPTAFQMLLEKNTDDYFTTSSSELKELASWLERKYGSGTPIASGILNAQNQTIGFSLPEIDPALMDGDNDGTPGEGTADYINPATRDTIGYYLITTTTDQAGVLVQPVLISLKNGEENPKNISLKGTTIDIAKRITHIGTKDEKDALGAEGTDGVNDNNDDYIYNKGSNADQKLGGTKGTVGKGDIVHYEISAQLPKYDTNVDLTTAEDFVINDYTTGGLDIVADSVKVYISEKDESAATYTRDTNSEADNWYLKKGSNAGDGDYSLNVAADKHSMSVTISVAQMRGTDEAGLTTGENGSAYTGSIAQTTAPTGSDTYYTNGYNKKGFTTMENSFIIVSFDAYVDGSATTNDHAATDADLDFDRSYIDPMSVTADTTTSTTAVINYSSDVDSTNATATANKLKEIYKAWKDYVTAGGYTKGDEEAILAAKAAETYSSYLGAGYFDDLAAKAAAVDGMYTGYSTPANLEKLLRDKTIGNAYSRVADTGEIAQLSAAEIKKEQVIALLLAIDHYNATRNGEINYADMTYGNNYSTGGNPAKAISNDTAVYSVDMNFNKFVEKLTLTYSDPANMTPANLATYVTWAELSARATSYTGDDVPTSEPTALTWTQVSTAFGAQTGSITANEDKWILQKAANEILNEKKTALEANKDYVEGWTKDAVNDAIFKLERVVDPSDTTKNELIGYAVSMGNSETAGQSGILKKLTVTKQTTAPASNNTAVKYYEKTGDNEYTVYTLDNDAEAGWAMFQQGTYSLTEIKAPTGFKKWTQPVTIEINALDAGFAAVTSSTQPDGAYKAIGYSTANTAAEIASKQDEAGLGAAKASAVEFNYWTTDKTNKASAGVLQHNIYNEYQDVLPATGGMGTVLFTAGGIAVVLMAGAMFVVYMKKRKLEDEE